jgi:hypothetical protein
MVGIAMDQDVAALRSYLTRKGIDWPQICDTQGRTSRLTRQFNAWSFPRHIVLDRDSKIVLNYSGAKGVPKVAATLAELLRQ